MINIFKLCFKTTNNNLSIASVLLCFLILLNIYLSIAQSAIKSLPACLLLIVTVCLMISAFLAGWFYMIKTAVKFCVENEDKEPINNELLKYFPIGIGEYFLTFLVFLILFIIIVIGVIIGTYYLGHKLIGDVGISSHQFRVALESPVAMKNLIATMSIEQITKLNKWNFLYVGVFSLFSLLTFTWIPEILNGTKNILIALFKSIKVLFVSPKILLIYLFVSLINFVLAIFNNFAMVNAILYFLTTLTYFYFMVYAINLIFIYYEKEITNDSKTESNSNSRTDSIGEE